MPAATCTHCHRPATRLLRDTRQPTCDTCTPATLETSIEEIAPVNTGTLTYLATAHLDGKRVWERAYTDADTARAAAKLAGDTFNWHHHRRGITARAALAYLPR